MAQGAKRRKVVQIEELSFDPAARQEYLTGFHKRKLHRIKQAQEIAQKQDREDKLKARKEIREQRKVDLERHVAEVNAMLLANAETAGFTDGKDGEGENDEWSGFEEPVDIGGTDEYIDEDKYTTVTIEAMDEPRQLPDAKQEADEDEVEESGTAAAKGNPDGATGSNLNKKRVWTKERPLKTAPKKRKKAFRYESKLDRKQTRTKQKAKNSEAAKARRAK